MNKTTELGTIEIKPAKNGFLVVCNLIDHSVDPAAASDMFGGGASFRQELYVEKNTADTLMTVDRILRGSEPNPKP